MGFVKIIAAMSLFVLLISFGFTTYALATPPPPKYDGTIGAVTIAFDHGFYDQINPMIYMKKDNFTGTLWVVTNRSPTQNALLFPWSQVQSLYNMGFEMESHSRIHLMETNGLSNATLYSEIYNSKQDLQNQGFLVCGFVPPSASFNATTMNIIKKFYNFSAQQTITQNSPATLSSTETLWGVPLVRIMGVANLDSTQLSYIQNFTAAKFQIDKAINNKAWVVLHFHDIVNITSGFDGLQYPASFSLYQQIIDYIKSKTDAGVLREMTESQAMGFGQRCEIITDKIPPVVSTPTGISLIGPSTGVKVNYTSNATDNVGILNGPTCNPASGSVFPFGDTIVTCTATDWAGNIGTNSFNVSVTNSKINTSLLMNPISSVPWGNKITVSGALINSTGEGIANKIISFNGTGAANLPPAKTDGHGFFLSSGAAPSTVATGLTVQAHFAEDSFYNKKDSTINSYNTLKHATQITLSVPGSVNRGQTYSISGTLKDTTSDVHPSSEAISFTVILTKNFNDTTTDSGGNYKSNLVAPNNAITFYIQASFRGDSLYTGDSSVYEFVKVN